MATAVSPAMPLAVHSKVEMQISWFVVAIGDIARHTNSRMRFGDMRIDRIRNESHKFFANLGFGKSSEK